MGKKTEIGNGFKALLLTIFIIGLIVNFTAIGLLLVGFALGYLATLEGK